MKAVSINNLASFKNKLEELFIQKGTSVNFANLKMELLCNDSTHLTQDSTTHTYILEDSYKNYDFIIFNISNTNNVKNSVIVSTLNIVNGLTSIFSWKGYVDSSDSVTSCKFNFIYTSNTEINVEVTLSSFWSYVYVEDIIGIKIDEMTPDFIASLSMPSSQTISIPIEIADSGETSYTYTAPANGYIRFKIRTQTNYRNMIISNNIVSKSQYSENHDNWVMSDTIQVANGDTITLYSYGTDAPKEYSAEFIYSIGSAKSLGLIS